nr:AAA family ATPase [Oceanirhabdus seepicola]
MLSRECLLKLKSYLNQEHGNISWEKYLCNIRTWRGTEHVVVDLQDELFKPLNLDGLKQGITTRQIIGDDNQVEDINEIQRVINEGKNNSFNKREDKKSMNNEPKNTIFYGPPGTGKTYNIINKCLEIIDKDNFKDIINKEDKREEAVEVYKKLVEQNRIIFCTFHQSYGYEEFVQGLRINENGGFEVRDGILKKICDAASTNLTSRSSKYDFKEENIDFHKMSLGNTNQDTDIYDYCIQNNVVALGWGENIDYSDCNDKEEIREKYEENSKEPKSFTIEAVERFKHWVETDDIIIVSQGNLKAKAIARVIGEYFYDDSTAIEYNHFRKVEWLYKDVTIPVEQIMKNKQFSQQSIYMFAKEDLIIDNIRQLLSEDVSEKDNNYVLVIDEINRGNISKIFGELITLIEEDKRIGSKNEIRVTLPYSENNEKFGIPNNLYILGTMNTADRSIALMDTALRRRFHFIEMMPNYSLLPEDVEGIDVQEFLRTINNRIEFLYDRDHMIGHAYFIKDDLKLEDLVNIMKNKVIPLLQEYFYEDWEKIELILGGTGKNEYDRDYFLVKKVMNLNDIFKKSHGISNTKKYKYEGVDNPTVNAFINVYKALESQE